MGEVEQGLESCMSLKARLSQPAAVLAPGAFDPLTALLIEQAGFEAAYLSGASVAYTLLGRPDIGLVSASQVADVVARIRDRVAIALIVDADTGFGNALNVVQTVRSFERAGASAIQLEDQTTPKRCGHLSGKELVSKEEMVGKVKAAVDARAQSETLIVARTDAISVEGFAAALDRAHAYIDAGADVIFVEAPQDEAQMSAIAAGPGARVPALANMVEGGKTPLKTKAELEALGFRLVITPGAMARAIVWQAQRFLEQLKADGATAGFRDRMLDLAGLNAVIGLNEQVALGQIYEPSLKDA
jgi:2-methylisocitrate lyase-like PEP mutase family enzyme